MNHANQLSTLNQQLKLCSIRQRRTLGNRLRRQRTRLKQGKDIQQSLQQLRLDIDQSIAQCQQRKDNLPRITYPESLPISQKRELIAQAIRDNQVTIIAGETGSGKTTQIPKICLELGRGIFANIGHTQPRRIAARSVATRIAEELKSPIGKDVGYKIRFSDHTQPNTYIKLMTDGILLAEIQHDPQLLQYDTIIIDEAHERSLNIDFLLGYLKNILPKRPDLKVIITSATINTERFSSFFHHAPVIEISGRSYPVEIQYRPNIQSETENDAQHTLQNLLDTVDEATRHDPLGDILIFLAGEREIRETNHALQQHSMNNTEILPLFSRLTAAEQDKVFRSHTGRRIVLATNVAETSLTVPGIRFVIDTGLARISRYSIRNKVQRLPIEPISQASANQRSGRCGRVAAGLCFRLYAEDDFNSRPEHTDPEIRRTNLAHVILQMTHLGLGNIEDFDFMEPPDTRVIRDGYRLLEELQAIDANQQLTPIGKQLIRLPVDPRLARMLVQASAYGSLQEVLIIVAALSVQDPRVRPADAQQKADEKHAIFTDKTSDFLSWVKLWNWYHEQAKHLSKSKLKKACQQHFLAYMRMREWLDLHSQLLGIIHALKLKLNQVDAKPDMVHKAILAGLLGHIALKHEEKGFLGARNLQVAIFPASALQKKPPQWIMAAFLVETSRLFARCVAPIDPTWLEELAPKLIKREYSEPHWSKKRAQVNAFEKVTLYGLPIISKRRIHFGTIDPHISREIFIRHALLYSEFHSHGKWFKHNLNLLQEIETLEAKLRRDLLSEEHVRFEFFDQLLPETVCSGKLFEQWRKKEEQQHPQCLFLSKDILLQQDHDALDSQQFPDYLLHQQIKLKLHYHFDPSQQHDGISVDIPILVLGQLSAHTFEWLVPGLLQEKIIAMIKSLPKTLRKNFVPAPQFAQACAESMDFAQTALALAVSRQLKRMTGIEIANKDWKFESIPQHLSMKLNILDEQGKSIGTGSHVGQLQQQFAHLARQSLQQASQQTDSENDNPVNQQNFTSKDGVTRWDFGDLPLSISQQQKGMQLLLFPALVDHKTSVSLTLFESESAANQAMPTGLRRLLMLTLNQQVQLLRKTMPHQRELSLFYSGMGKSSDLLDDIIAASFDSTFLQHPYPRNQHDFTQRLEQGRSKVVAQAQHIAQDCLDTLTHYASLQQRLTQVKAAPLMPIVDDIKQQVQSFIQPGFIANTPTPWLKHLPRFIQAAEQRLAKAGQNINQDKAHRQSIETFTLTYQKECTQRQDHHESCADIQHFPWLIEELRVSLFAQSLKTSVPVSIKRLNKAWDKLIT
ncbi:MAG: ATP-dependent RNA helicase HrpA [Ghiorsea sp.]